MGSSRGRAGEGRSSRLRLRAGSLRYELLAADEWGQQQLSRLAQHVACVSFDEAPHRTVHYHDLDYRAPIAAAVKEHRLPPQLGEVAAVGATWDLVNNYDGSITWWSGEAHESLITPARHPQFPTRYHFPWHPLVHDAATRRAALVHAGLALHDGGGYLFTAPPGGGKTTTLNDLPPDWQLLADDGSLLSARQHLLPQPDPVSRPGSFMASPLPTWSHSLGLNDFPTGIRAWEVGTSVTVHAALLVQKADRDDLRRMDPLAATSAFFRAFSEHPAVIHARTGLRRALFDTVCSLVEAVPCWELRLTKARDELPALLEAVSDGP